MDIRSETISYSRRKSKRIRNRGQGILWKLDLLDSTICNNFSSPNVDDTLQEYKKILIFRSS